MIILWIDPHIWDGLVDFPNVADVKLSATLVTTTINDSTNEVILRSKRMITDTANLKRKLDVTGRLQSSIADDYLGKITQTRDLYLIELKPFEEEEKYKFIKAWEYFQSRSINMLSNISFGFILVFNFIHFFLLMLWLGH